MASLITVHVQWLAWSDHGGGLARGNSVACQVRPTCLVQNIWGIVKDSIQGVPPHYKQLWAIKGGRFMHDQDRTLKSYGAKDNDTLYLLVTCAEPLISG